MIVNQCPGVRCQCPVVEVLSLGPWGPCYLNTYGRGCSEGLHMCGGYRYAILSGQEQHSSNSEARGALGSQPCSTVHTTHYYWTETFMSFDHPLYFGLIKSCRFEKLT